MKEKELLRLQELKKIEEDIYTSQKINYICGIDEAGRGPLAGPVVVASVIMPRDSMIEGVNDSKKVSEKKREKLYEEIIENAISYSVGIVDQNEIDRVNILNATKAGLTESIKGLNIKPDIILVDALTGIDTCEIPYNSIIKGYVCIKGFTNFYFDEKAYHNVFKRIINVLIFIFKLYALLFIIITIIVILM